VVTAEGERPVICPSELESAWVVGTLALTPGFGPVPGVRAVLRAEVEWAL
jgi:hypothetical protein